MISTPKAILNVNTDLVINILGFFFRVTNVFKGSSVKFNILNHTKTDSLFNYGMKVLVYSEGILKNSGVGWHREGRDIAYFQNNYKKVRSHFFSHVFYIGYCRKI